MNDRSGDAREHTAAFGGCRSVRGRVVVSLGVGYLLGTFPSADLAARLARAGDLRELGTHNPGGMNASHVLGRRWGALVTAADVAKGTVAARVGHRLAGPTGANVAAVAAVVGHCFPPGRSGGKGVATSIGQVVGTFPVYLPLDLAVGAATAASPRFRQRTRTATTVASGVWIVAATVWWRGRLPNPGGVAPTVALPLAAVATAVVIAARFAAGADEVAAYNAASAVAGEVPRTEAAW